MFLPCHHTRGSFSVIIGSLNDGTQLLFRLPELIACLKMGSYKQRLHVSVSILQVLQDLHASTILGGGGGGFYSPEDQSHLCVCSQASEAGVLCPLRGLLLLSV